MQGVSEQNEGCNRFLALNSSSWKVVLAKKQGSYRNILHVLYRLWLKVLYVCIILVQYK